MVFIRDALPAGVLEACEFVFRFRHPDDVVIIVARFVNKQRAAATEVGQLAWPGSRLPACRIWESSTGKMPVGRDTLEAYPPTRGETRSVLLPHAGQAYFAQ